MARYKPAHRAQRKQEQEEAKGAGSRPDNAGSTPAAGPASAEPAAPPAGPPVVAVSSNPVARASESPAPPRAVDSPPSSQRQTGELPAILRAPSVADRSSGWVDTSPPGGRGPAPPGRSRPGGPAGEPSWMPSAPAPRQKGGFRRVLVGLLLLVVVVAAGLGGVWVWKSRQPAAHRAAPATGAEQAEQTGSKTGAVVKGQIGPAGPTADWVKAENAKPGTSDWHLVKDATNGQIEGFADRVSITAGESANLYVSTTAPTFHVEAYRMGFYQGLGARLVWKSDDVTGVKQAKATFTPGVNMVEAPWSPSLSLRTDPSWPEGDYLMKLVASTGYQRYVPLTIRNDQNAAAYVVINAVTTWQAYNLWGDYDLYQGAVGRGADFYHRSREVSFDRPYLIGSGGGDFLGNELPFVSMAESLGLDITYTTSVDVHENPATLQRHKAALSMGHDEYYSMNMRQGMQDARDKGVNLVFFGANAIYRHIRFESSPNGPDRRVICYKSTSDPLMGINNPDVTVDWRDPPNLQPESVIVGNYYQCNPVKADMVVAAPDHWLLAGTGLADGQHLLAVVGDEYDRYSPGAGSPRNLEVIMHSPVLCHGLHDYSDVTYYTASSGAGVFASGTSSWAPALGCTTPGCAGPTLVKITQNLLAAFGLGPAGQKHPSTANAVAISEGANTAIYNASSTAIGTGTPQASATTPPTTARAYSPPYYPPTTVRRYTTTSVRYPPTTTSRH